MDRRSFLKGAAAAVAVAPALPAIAAAPPALITNTISAEQIAAGAITAQKMDIVAVYSSHGFRLFKGGVERLAMGVFDENGSLGEIRFVVHGDEVCHVG